MNDFWRRCSNCKRKISHQTVYQECSVSTCKKNVYCTVDCWEVHVPILNHKTAFAEEAVSPSKTDKRRIVVQKNKTSKVLNNTAGPKDILIVASKLKNYVKTKHDYNTSANVMDKLSDIVRVLVDDAILKAREEGRKTLMDRDF